MNTRKTIGILTGGGDVPGLNPAIRAVTVRANLEGYRVIGIKRGWAGLVDMVREKDADNSDFFEVLTNETVKNIGRTGGTFLHSSRTRPSHIPKDMVPDHLTDKYNKDINDLTDEVLINLDFIGIDALIPIGGDDTLSYGVHLHNKGFNVIAIPKTMDNDVPGTDYCIGFSTCVSRTIEIANALRTSAGSHERFMVIEVFGRYAGYTALLPTMAGAADRCIIPEHNFDMDKLTELLSYDRNSNPSKYSIVLVSEGALDKKQNMIYSDEEKDMYGHKKLGGIGDIIAEKLREISPKYNNGKRVNTITQRLGYLVRSGNPDAVDSIVPMVYGNIAFDLINDNSYGKLVCLRNGEYDSVPIDIITSRKKQIDVAKYYDTDRLRPIYKKFTGMPFFLITQDF